MPIDASIALQGKPVQLSNPLETFANFLTAQKAMNENALFPLQQQQMEFNLMKGQRQLAALNAYAALDGQQGDAQSGNVQNALMQGAGTPRLDEQGNMLAPQNLGPTPQAANALTSMQTQQQPNMIARRLKALDGLAASGIDTKSLFDQFKFGVEGGKIDPGYRLNPMTGQMEYNADPTKSVTIDPRTGKVSLLNGAIEAQSALTGATKGGELDAANARTAPNTALEMPGPNGKMIVVPGATLAEQLATMHGQATPQAGQTQTAAPSGASGLDLSKLNPQQVAALAKQDPTAFANGVQDFQKTAYAPPTVGVSGLPIAPQTQALLSQVQQSRDPGQLQQVVQTAMQNINKLPEGPEKQAHLRDLQAEASRIQQSWQQPKFGATGSGFSGLATPNDIALDKSKAEAALKLQNDPTLGYATKAADALQTKAERVGAQLSESQNLLQRIAESREALKKFQAGGGMDTKVELAKYAQALHMPDAIVNGLAGGNLAAAQEFQKYAAQEALGTMQQALASDTGKGSQGNKIAMQLFIKNNPNIDTDPNAVEKIFNFQTKLHNELLNKSDMLAKFVSDPSTVKDPIVFDNLYAKHQLATGNVKAQMVQGQAKGTTPVIPANVQSVLDKYK